MTNLESMAQKVFDAEATVRRISGYDSYQQLMYSRGAEQRGFAVGGEAGRVHSAHKWFSAGVEAAYLAIQDRPDVPVDVKQGLASYAGSVHGLKTE